MIILANLERICYLCRQIKNLKRMKRVFIIILVCASITVSFAQSGEVKKVIKKFDVAKTTKGASFNSPSSFWFAVRDNNKRVKDIGKAYQKDNKSLKETLVYLGENVDDYSQISNLSAYDDSLAYWLTGQLGLNIVAKNKPIKILWSNEFNASMDPTGQMALNKGLVNALTYEEILAVCAHEMAHYICAHALSETWSTVKKLKRNREWAKIGASLAVGMMAASSAYAGSNGVDMTSMNNMIANSDLFYQSASNYADGATLRYRYRYGRNEELEADIIAYRFMEAMGYGTEHWISAMRKMLRLTGDYSVKAGKHDDHPTTMFRLQVLTAMESGYNGK